MADLALRLKVFIASPSDVRAERDVAEQEIIAVQREYAHERLLIEPYRWEASTTPTFRRIQAAINTQLRTAELTIAILGTTLGTVAKSGQTGSLEEITVAGERVAAGYSDDVFLYFKSPPPGADADRVAAVRRFRDHIVTVDKLFIADFDSTEEFATQVRADLRLWAQRWRDVPDICAYALREAPGGAAPEHILGESRLARLKQIFDPESRPDLVRVLGRAAITMYQALGSQANVLSLSEHAEAFAVPAGGGRGVARLITDSLAPFISGNVLERRGESLYFNHAEWFYFFCACGLLDAIHDGNVSAVERRAYVNPVHQYLQALALRNGRGEIIETLRAWLLDRHGVTAGRPVARNFAAYVLGMLNAIEAQEDLARVIGEDLGEDVRKYCVASLGRMRARVQLPVLVDLFKRTDDPELRLMTAQAVSRMVGVADYPM